MEDAALIEQLSLFGLSRQEAVIYLCLLRGAELTGYEVAKLTGISRSNVYNGLAALVEHGAAYVLEGASTRYTAVNLKEFCDNRIAYLKSVQERLVKNSPKKALPREGYITVESCGHICDRIHHMLLGTELRIYFSAKTSFLEKWGEELAQLVGRKRKVVLIAEDGGTPFEGNAALTDGICLYRVPKGFRESEEEQDQVRLIIDSEFILTGEVTGKGSDTCLYSAQKNFVSVFKDAMRNEIELIKLRESGKKESGGEQ